MILKDSSQIIYLKVSEKENIVAEPELESSSKGAAERRPASGSAMLRRLASMKLGEGRGDVFSLKSGDVYAAWSCKCKAHKGNILLADTWKSLCRTP